MFSVNRFSVLLMLATATFASCGVASASAKEVLLPPIPMLVDSNAVNGTVTCTETVSLVTLTDSDNWVTFELADMADATTDGCHYLRFTAEGVLIQDY